MNNDSNLAQAVPTMLGRYRLLRSLGHGGMGDVWLAEDERLRRQVAIKTLPSHNQGDREYAQRFEREAQAAAALNHPHILPVHDYGTQALPNGQAITYIVMPYISGGSLADRIKTYAVQNISMPLTEALNYLAQAADAIDYAHSRGIIHRDIKPGNMLLTTDNWLLLADFGIARILSASEQLTRTGTGIGTPDYMAPEQAQGHAEMASDNYSLAVIAYQLLVGRLPFKAENSYATTIQHLTMPPPPPRQFNPTLSLACEQVLLQGLAKSPAQRLPSARAFVAALQQATANAPYEATLLPAQSIYTGNLTPQQSSINSAVSSTLPTMPDTTATSITPQPLARAGLTRRQLVIGGGITLVVVLAGSGAGLWALTKQNGTLSLHQQTSHANAGSSPTSHNPDTPVLTLLGHNHPVSTLAWSPTTTMLASAGSNGDGQVFLWDVATLYRQATASPHYAARQQFSGAANSLLLAWSYDGSKLAIGNTGGTANLTNLASTTNISVYSSDLSGYAPGYNANFVVNNSSALDALAWTTDGYLLGITSSSLSSLSSNDILYVWDNQHPQQQPAAITLPFLLQTSSAIPSINFGPFAPSPHDAHTLALGTTNGVVLGTLNFSGYAPGAGGTGQNVSFKQNHVLQLVGQQDGYDPIGAITWDHGGTYLAAIADPSSNPQIITIWNVPSQQQYNPRALPTQAASMTALAWCPAPASTLLAAGTTGGQVYIWDFNGNTGPVRTLQGINATITALAWSADGQWLAAGYNDTNDSILVWKIS